MCLTSGCELQLCACIFLGTEYYSLHYYPSTLFEEFAITPSRDDTQVTVTLSSYLSGTVNSDLDIGGLNSVSLQVFPLLPGLDQREESHEE